MCVCVSLRVCTELFQLVAVQLPPSPQQQVEVLDLSAVIDDVSSNPAATAFGREVQRITTNMTPPPTPPQDLRPHVLTLVSAT